MKKERSCPKFHVKKSTLLAIAGTVWVIAGVNVARLGLIAYSQLGEYSLFNLFLSLSVFLVFVVMFYKMSLKHFKRISIQRFWNFWHFFDFKGYIIMAFMMGGGIWLRSSGLAPTVFIEVFYTGLGFALASAGVSFWYMFFKNR